MPKTFILILSVMLFMDDPRPVAAQGPYEDSAAAQAYVLAKLRDHDIVFMGTTHKQPEIPAFMAALLPHLHGVGATHLVLEIAADQQARLDHFLTTGRGLETIQLHPAIDGPDYRRWLQALADLPPALRPEVKALDLPPDGYDGPLDRDGHIAAGLLEIFQTHPEAKILVELGSLHVLCKLPWAQRLSRRPEAIRTRLQAAKPELRLCSLIQIVGRAEPHCDFGRELGPLPGIVAMDLDPRFSDWHLGLARCIALEPTPPHELAEGVIVY
ncbi:MAG: hypothetical protein HZB24_15950 [Desulfobacterales bacterium]|nr:hypothetical protein [Desulfobacterales bacterium]